MSEYLYIAVPKSGAYLYHHGIRGQRWGIRRYQNPDGTLTPEGRKRYSDDGRKYTRSERRQIEKEDKIRSSEEKKRLREEAAAKKAEEEKARHIANKDRVLKEGSATDIMAYVNELTNTELQNALNRVKWRSELAGISEKELNVTARKIDKMMSKVDTFNKWSTIGINTAKNAKSVYDLVQAMKGAREAANRKPQNKGKAS